MRVGISGGCGYIGSVLCRLLLEQGHKVVVLDNLLFGSKAIDELKSNPNFKFVEGDVRNDHDIEEAIVGCDAVVHLAAIVGDPECDVKPKAALSTNFDGVIRVAKICKKRGIKSMIFSSTCSCYGSNEEGMLTEESRLNPLSLYAHTKLYAERALLAMMDDNFKPTILRFGTAYGQSPRMRYDLVVNTLTRKAVVDKRFVLYGGDQWRPFVHIKDISRAILLCLENDTGGKTYNVGSTSENYQMRDIGILLKEMIPDVIIDTMPNPSDRRDYHVSFEKIEKELGFKNIITLRKGIEEMKNNIT